MPFIPLDPSQGRGRRISLGLLSGRLRGGFTASSIPRATPRLPESRSGTPPSIADVLQDRSQAEGSVGPVDVTATNSNDVCVHLASMSATLRAVQEAVKKLDHRVATVEQGQQRLTASFTELSTLLKSRERETFSIKGSTWEVKCASSVVHISSKVPH